jgi:hypothetical protein
MRQKPIISPRSGGLRSNRQSLRGPGQVGPRLLRRGAETEVISPSPRHRRPTPRAYRFTADVPGTGSDPLPARHLQDEASPCACRGPSRRFTRGAAVALVAGTTAVMALLVFFLGVFAAGVTVGLTAVIVLMVLGVVDPPQDPFARIVDLASRARPNWLGQGTRATRR